MNYEKAIETKSFQHRRLISEIRYVFSSFTPFLVCFMTGPTIG